MFKTPACVTSFTGGMLPSFLCEREPHFLLPCQTPDLRDGLARKFCASAEVRRPLPYAFTP